MKIDLIRCAACESPMIEDTNHQLLAHAHNASWANKYPFSTSQDAVQMCATHDGNNEVHGSACGLEADPLPAGKVQARHHSNYWWKYWQRQKERETCIIACSKENSNPLFALAQKPVAISTHVGKKEGTELISSSRKMEELNSNKGIDSGSTQ